MVEPIVVYVEPRVGTELVSAGNDGWNRNALIARRELIGC